MDNTDVFENQQIRRLQIFLYLVPVFGFLPACWTLHSRKSNSQQRSVSRLVITLTLGWLVGYVLLETGAQAMIEAQGKPALSLLLMNGVLTSSYFLVNLWLMSQFWQHHPLKLPGISRVARHLP